MRKYNCPDVVLLRGHGILTKKPIFQLFDIHELIVLKYIVSEKKTKFGEYFININCLHQELQGENESIGDVSYYEEEIAKKLEVSKKMTKKALKQFKS